MEKSLLAILLVCTLCMVSPTLAKNLCLSGDFEEQAATLLNYIRLSDEGIGNLFQAARDVERVLQPRWPGSKLTAYGSTVTGLALKSSDIDCYVDIPGGGADQQALVTDVVTILKNHSNLFQDFEIWLTATIPLITCVHVPTNVFVDLTFSGSFVVNSSLMLSHLLHMDQRALDLATIVKYWGSVHDIANGKVTLPAYAIALLTLFYLQQKGIVPSVATLQKNMTPHELDHWNVAFDPIKYHTDNNETLYELLGGFFKYYSDLDFENTVISPYVGYPIKREDFEKVSFIFPGYKENLANDFAHPFRFGHLNVQDTLKLSENIARPNTERWLALRLIKALKYCAWMYDTLSSEEFLSAVLVPERRVEAGFLKTFWSGGVGAPEDCILKKKLR